MRVNIDEIKEAGLRRSWDVAREEADKMMAGDRAGYRARGPVHVDARLEKIHRRIRVDAHGKAELTVPCGRCLRPVAVDLPVEFELTLVPRDEYEEAPRGEKEEHAGRLAGSFEPEEAEEEAYSGKVIDLDPLVREQLVLSLPSYPVCRPDCKGLCPVCGTDLNDNECGCDRMVPDPRWAGLKKLKLQ
ncbi:MAG TPA: DUF177 domain-containing protein [Anaeromyxobacteraceae bacterium]|nr:DUF177 domain-containing protein [Anaeromyxobacteraceae bacterium]